MTKERTPDGETTFYSNIKPHKDYLALAEQLKAEMYTEIKFHDAVVAVRRYWNHPHNEGLRKLELPADDFIEDLSKRLMLDTISSFSGKPLQEQKAQLNKNSSARIERELTEDRVVIKDDGIARHFVPNNFVQSAKSDRMAWEGLRSIGYDAAKEGYPLPPEIGEILLRPDGPPKGKRGALGSAIQHYYFRRFLMVASVAAVYFGTGKKYSLSTTVKEVYNAHNVVAEATGKSQETVRMEAWRPGLESVGIKNINKI